MPRPLEGRRSCRGSPGPEITSAPIISSASHFQRATDRHLIVYLPKVRVGSKLGGISADSRFTAILAELQRHAAASLFPPTG